MQAITFVASGRNRHVLEVPEGVASRLGTDFEFVSQRKVLLAVSLSTYLSNTFSSGSGLQTLHDGASGRAARRAGRR